MRSLISIFPAPEMEPGRMHRLVKKTKEKRSHFWDRLAVPKMKWRPQNRMWYASCHLVKQQAYRVGTGEARTCEA